MRSVKPNETIPYRTAGLTCAENFGYLLLELPEQGLQKGGPCATLNIFRSKLYTQVTQTSHLPVCTYLKIICTDI